MESLTKKILLFFAVAFLAYIGILIAMNYLYEQDTEQYKQEYNAVNLQKEEILDSLHILKATYQIAIAENTSIKADLIAEKEKVELLMWEIRDTHNLTPNQFRAYTNRFRGLKKILDSRSEEIRLLRKENKVLLSEIENQNVKMYHQSLQKDTLVRQKEELVTKVQKAENLVLKDFKLLGMKQKKDNEPILIDNANKVDKLVVSFLVQGNSVAKAGTKTYFVQILDQNNTILGERETLNLDNDNKLIYSFTIDVDYQNKDVNAIGFLSPYEKRFKKGTYFLKIFDKYNLIGSSSLTLR